MYERERERERMRKIPKREKKFLPCFATEINILYSRGIFIICVILGYFTHFYCHLK